VRGELIGGCDIVIVMYDSGELAQTLGIDQPPAPAPAPAPTEAAGPAGSQAGSRFAPVENRLG